MFKYQNWCQFSAKTDTVKNVIVEAPTVHPRRKIFTICQIQVTACLTMTTLHTCILVWHTTTTHKSKNLGHPRKH